MDTHPVTHEVLYRRRPNGRYEPVEARVPGDFRFPRGRWVLYVEPGRSCCLQSLPDVDDALWAALQKFRWVLEDALVAAGRAEVVANLSKKKLARIEALLGPAVLTVTKPAAGSVVLTAVEHFARSLPKE